MRLSTSGSVLLLSAYFTAFSLRAQINNSAILAFDFNGNKLSEKNGKVKIKPVGVTLCKDRFGNEASAAYLHGSAMSYLNLGSDPMMKLKTGSVSLWINLDRRIYTGRGYQSNPIIITKNGPGPDFNVAYEINYDGYAKRFAATMTKDSTREALVSAKEETEFGRWYHLVITFDNNYFAFYVNGNLQQKVTKGFETVFMESDSVVIGNSASKKNYRWSQGKVDDIYFFNKVLTPQEVTELYNLPNPDTAKERIRVVLMVVCIILFFSAVILLIIVRYRKTLKRQREFYELNNKISELEIKVIKNQINPHFISNSLASIQELIYAQSYKEAGLYIAKFSYFLRQVLNLSDNMYITLNQELEIMNLYIELERLRFRNNFEFELKLNIKSNPDSIYIPTLITQPFVENAIWHGLIPMPADALKKLTVNVSEKNDAVYVEIEDNGIGRAHNPDKNRIPKGTQLVHDKIASINKLMKANNYRLDIIDLSENGKPSGTKVILQLKGGEDL